MKAMHVLKTGLISVLTLASINVSAQRAPGLFPGPNGGGLLAPPPFVGGPLVGPVGGIIGGFNSTRSATAIIQKNLAHGETLGVRKLVSGLNKGDMVLSLDVEAQATQPGAYLEVIVDDRVVGQIALRKRPETTPYVLNMRNGVDYNRLLVRSIGTSFVLSITAQIEVIGGGDVLPPLPPPPPPFHPPQPPVNPPPYNPPQPPPYYPGVSLGGYCEDFDHRQFEAAKNFAYSSTGLDLDSNGSVNWALNYNQTHACGTIGEYSLRFTTLKNFAYASTGLDMDSANAIRYALSKVETTTSQETQRLQVVLTAIKNFAYASSGLDLDSTNAALVARQWIDRGYCEDENGIRAIAARYSQEYNFAYSSNGLNYDSARAKEYAVSRVRPMSRCSDLIR